MYLENTSQIHKDICSVTDFKRNSGTILNRVIEGKAPVVLILNDSSDVVVIDVGSSSKLGAKAVSKIIKKNIIIKGLRLCII